VNRDRFEFLGLHFENLSLAQSVERVVEFVASGVPHMIFTLNAELIVRAQSDTWLRSVYDAADLVTVDSYVVGYGARLCRRPVREPVSAARLMFELLPVANERGYRIFLLGATRGVVDAVSAHVATTYPGVVLSGARDGYFGPGDEAGIVESIRASGADLLFVGMSTPLKEAFIGKNLAALGVPVCIGVGGAFDILAGKTRHAPRWMSRLCLEWFYRFMQEPRRLWKRYLTTNSMFLRLLVGELLRQRKRGSK
jgi:N-acetylglucosaminyldiphosphoundecaprenol N-acetyl-beta-D-mannosaminyltransferase